MERMDSNRDFYIHVLSSIIHNTQKVETVQINGGMDK